MANFTKQELWDEMVAKNQDFYGKGVMDFAERWADLMELAISNGAVLEDIADRTSHEADTDGITGFMYGAAVQTLVECEWLYGEPLRRWHNADWGAADSDGVVNPALLTFSGPDDEGEVPA